MILPWMPVLAACDKYTLTHGHMRVHKHIKAQTIELSDCTHKRLQFLLLHHIELGIAIQLSNLVQASTKQRQQKHLQLSAVVRLSTFANARHQLLSVSQKKLYTVPCFTASFCRSSAVFISS